jgi:hypothetical protein
MCIIQVHLSSNHVCSTAQSAAAENSKLKKLQTSSKMTSTLMISWFWMEVMRFTSGLGKCGKKINSNMFFYLLFFRTGSTDEEKAKSSEMAMVKECKFNLQHFVN